MQELPFVDLWGWRYPIEKSQRDIAIVRQNLRTLQEVQRDPKRAATTVYLSTDATVAAVDRYTVVAKKKRVHFYLSLAFYHNKRTNQ